MEFAPERVDMLIKYYIDSYLIYNADTLSSIQVQHRMSHYMRSKGVRPNNLIPFANVICTLK